MFFARTRRSTATVAGVALIAASFVGSAAPSSPVSAAVDAPVPPNVVAQSGAAAVAVYLAPGAPAQTIEVRASDGQTCTYESTANDTFCTISGLDNGTQYTFTATTTINGETSPASIASSATPTIVSDFITEDLIPTTSDALEYTHGLTLVDSTNTYRYAIGGQRGLTGKFRNSDGELINTGVVGSQYSGPRSGTMLTDSMFVIGTDQNADVKSVDADTLDVLDTLENLQYGIADIIKDPASDDHVYVIGNAGRTYGYSAPVIRYVEVASNGTLTIEATTALTSGYSNRSIRVATLVDPSATAGDEYFVVSVSGANIDGDFTTFEPDEVVKVPLALLTADSTVDTEDTGDLALSGLTKLEVSAANTSDVALYIEALVEHNGVIYFGGRGGVDPWPPRIGRVAADLSGFSSVMEGTPSVVGMFGDLLVGYNSSYALLDNEVALYDTTTTPMTLVGGATRADLGNIAGLTVVSDGIAYSTGDDYGNGVSGFYFPARVMDLDAPLSISRPSSPTVNSFSGSSSGIYLSWDGSEDDGGFPLRGYLVEMKIGDGDFEAVDDCADELADSEASWCQISSSSISAGEDHQVRVSAVTAAGRSEPGYSTTVQISDSSSNPGPGPSEQPDAMDPEPVLTVGQVDGALKLCLEINGAPANYISVWVQPSDFEYPIGEPEAGFLFPASSREFIPQEWLDGYPGESESAVVWGGEDVSLLFDQDAYRPIPDSPGSVPALQFSDWQIGTEYRVQIVAEERTGPPWFPETSTESIYGTMDEPILYTFAAEDVECGVSSSSSDSPSSDSSSTTVPGSSSDVPLLVTSGNAEQVAVSAGSAKILINGELVEVDVVQASEELRRSVAGARSFAQVRTLQALAVEMFAAVQAVLGEGVTLPITVTNTDTGATITGLVSDPVSGDPLAVPVEDVLLIVNESLALMVGGADGAGDPANIAFDGVLEFGEGGYVAVLAYGLTPGAAGEVVVMSTPRLLDSFTVGSDGGVAAQAEIPSDLEAGEHTVVVAIDGQSASLGFRVLPEGVLPATGGESTPVPFAVLVLAAGGLAMLLVTRRRNVV